MMTLAFLLQAAPVELSPDRPAREAAPAPSQAPSSVAAPRRPLTFRSPSPRLRAVASATRAATIEPAAQGFVNAIQVYPFGEGLVYQVYTRPGRVTDIALQPGERLISVASGDTVRWIIGDTTSGTGNDQRTHIFVKPFAVGLSTNLVVTTDRRTYHLAAVSSDGPAMAGLSWSYPNDALLALSRTGRAAAPPSDATALAIERLRFDYAISGDRPAWRPVRAFDDGRQTFIEFPSAIGVGEVPPLFLIDGNGEAQLVNYRMQGRFYVVDRLFDAAELRLGGKRQTIVRIARAAGGKSGKGS